jgi:transcriptional regulator with XRE-family HTH domain
MGWSLNVMPTNPIRICPVCQPCICQGYCSGMTLNQALQAAMRRKGMTQVQLAAAVDVSRNTVAAWVNDGTRPRTDQLRRDVGQALDVDPDAIWPPELEPAPSAATGELLGIWPRRADVPADLWGQLLRADAGEAVDYVAYAGAWLVDVVPALLRQLAGLATTGTRVRVLLADAESDHVARRDAEEKLGGSLKLRVAEAGQLFADALHGIDGADVRFYGPAATSW